MSRKVQLVKIADLKTPCYVRKELDDDRVWQFALLFEKNAEVQPIDVTDELEVVDGRHRIAGASLAGRETIAANVVGRMSHAEILSRAFRANTGGPKPPTKEDIFYTIVQLFAQRFTYQRIIEALEGPHFPPAVVRRYIDDAQSRLFKARLIEARRAVEEKRMSFDEAVARYNVKRAQLRAAMARKQKHVPLRASVKGHLSMNYQRIHRSNAAVYVRLFEEFSQGEVDTPLVNDVLEHALKLSLNGVKLVESYQARFEELRRSMEHEVA